MKNLGYGLGIFGTVIALFSFGFNTAPEGTHNIGLLQQQIMIFALGCVLGLAGATIGSIAVGLSRMEDAGLLPQSGVPVTASNIVTSDPDNAQ